MLYGLHTTMLAPPCAALAKLYAGLLPPPPPRRRRRLRAALRTAKSQVKRCIGTTGAQAHGGGGARIHPTTLQLRFSSSRTKSMPEAAWNFLVYQFMVYDLKLT